MGGGDAKAWIAKGGVPAKVKQTFQRSGMGKSTSVTRAEGQAPRAALHISRRLSRPDSGPACGDPHAGNLSGNSDVGIWQDPQTPRDLLMEPHCLSRRVGALSDPPPIEDLAVTGFLLGLLQIQADLRVPPAEGDSLSAYSGGP